MGEKASMWNLWHGCHKLSEGCRHCYVYREAHMERPRRGVLDGW